MLLLYPIILNYQTFRYDIKNFNCVDYTIESMLYFSLFGIKSYQVIGLYNITINGTTIYKGHSWLGIDIFGYIIHYEPQTFSIFNPKEKYTHIIINN